MRGMDITHTYRLYTTPIPFLVRRRRRPRYTLHTSTPWKATSPGSWAPFAIWPIQRIHGRLGLRVSAQSSRSSCVLRIIGASSPCTESAAGTPPPRPPQTGPVDQLGRGRACTTQSDLSQGHDYRTSIGESRADFASCPAQSEYAGADGCLFRCSVLVTTEVSCVHLDSEGGETQPV